MRTSILKKAKSFPHVQHDCTEYECDQCGEKVRTDINGPDGWVHIQIRPDGYDFCCLSCALKGIGKLIYNKENAADFDPHGPDCSSKHGAPVCDCGAGANRSG